MKIVKIVVKYFCFVVLIFCSKYLFSQIESAQNKLKKGESIIYFDKDWNIIPSKYNAEYYRIFKIGINNSSNGEIKDYYKSGKIQNVIEKAIYFDLENEENWKFDGLSKVYYETGEVESKYIYVDNKKEGFSRTYYKSGKLKSISEYKNGLLNGNKSTYRESGKLEYIISYENDVSMSVKNYNEDGTLKYHLTKKNENTGEITKFFDSGEKYSKVNVRWDDKESMLYDGSFKTFYKTGQVKSAGFYKNDQLDGSVREYSPNGKLMLVVKFKNNEETVRYLKDKYENTIVTLYPEDETITEYTCVDADCDEIFHPYFDEEENALWVKYIWTFTKKSNFKYGTAYRIILDEKGEHSTLLLKVEVINEKSSGLNFYKWHGKKYSYYKNSKLESESTYVNDKKDGQEVSYNKYGNVTSTVEWNNGVKNNWTKDCSKTPCEYTFKSYFNNKEEAENQGWKFNDNEYQENFIPSEPANAEGTYFWKNKNDYGHINSIDLPINFDENFQASVSTKYWNGESGSWFGIIVGWEDWDNYVSLQITPNGYYQADIIKSGINFGMQDGQKLEGRNFYDRVKLNIVKRDGKLVFTINQKIVYITEFSKIIGEKCGLYNSGIKSVLFDNFKVTKYKANQTSKPKPDYSSKNQWAGNGSGIIISKNGLIATNNHVIKGSSEIEVEFLYNNEIKSFKAKVVKTDPTNDLAIIKIDDNAFTGLSTIRYNFKTRSSQVGESVFALGYPKALSLMGKEMKFTDGKISSKTGFQGDVTTYQTTTPIQPGNSGGPLFDYNGNFIGINSAKIVQDDVDNVSYSIKSLYLLTLIDALAESVELPSDNSISSLPLTTKIKKLEKYVTLIKVR